MAGYLGPKAIQYNVDNSVVHGDSSVGGDLTVNGNLQVNGTISPPQYSNPNLVINGAMQVAQRGTSYSFSSGNSLCTTVDRFKQSYFGTWGNDHSEITQETDGPDGFSNSLKVKALVAQDYSSALGSWVRYSFENQDITSLQNGSGLKDFTTSLWLKSNKTGNVSIAVETEGYSYSTYVTINSANTWEYKTITFPATTLDVGIDYTGDPSGTDFNLKVGLGSDGSWLVDTDYQWNDRTTNRGAVSPQQTNFQAAVNDYLQITGIKLEVGSVATSFEHRLYGEELALCQRYYQNIFFSPRASSSSGPGSMPSVAFTFMTRMRAAPTGTLDIASNSGSTPQIGGFHPESGYAVSTVNGTVDWTGTMQLDAEL